MAYILIPICFLIDQFSKNKALERFSTFKKAQKLNGLINFRIVYNEGAFLGILKKKKSLLLIMNVISLLLLILSLAFITMSKSIELIKVAVSLLIGGALGNIYDRVKRKKVVDFFSFKIRPNVYFNIADMFIFIGSILLIIGYLLSES